MIRLICALLVGVSSLAQAERPNILVFITDDVGWKDFGCYGNDVIRTPNIDKLAARGLLFENAFLTIAQCSPSRISMMTGRYPHATGAEDLHMPLPEGTKMIPAHLSEAGYFTGGMKKMHFGKHGEAQFDWYNGGLTRLDDFLNEAEEKPFFMWVGFSDAHRPYADGAFDPPQDPKTLEVPPYLVDTPETRKDLADYYDEISRLDSVIGEHLAILKKRKLLKNTFVMFVSDNGMPFPRAKGTVYDSGIGTPLIMAWPGEIDEARRYAGLTSVIDLAPTILEVAGLDPAGREYQGKSLMPVIRGEEVAGATQVFSERNWHNCDEHIRSVRTEKYKLIRNAYLDLPHGTPADLGKSPSFADLLTVKKAGTLSPAQAGLFVVPRPAYELYDVQADPWETNNIVNQSEMADVVAQLSRALEQWRADTGDFTSEYRRRGDNTNRFTGVKFTRENPPMTHPLP
ncbi:MAG: sulfatase [Candidatus Hydrogenedentota bacterium]